MKRRMAAVLIAVMMTTSPTALPQSSTASMLLPSPVSLILLVGRWIVEPAAGRVYYVRVQARGDTEQQARQEAYKRAVEEAVGSLVLAESVVINDELRRREIIDYSSGYVDRSQVINQYHDGRHFVVDMDIWVRHSHIADRLLNQSESTAKVDGARLRLQGDTLAQERHQGQRVLATVLADYPHRAYQIQNQVLESRFSSRRTLDVTLGFDLVLAPGFLYSLYESMRTVSQTQTSGDCRSNCSSYTVVVQGRHDRVLFNRWQWSFGFHDDGQAHVIEHMLTADPAAVLLTVRDGAQHAIWQQCYFWSELDGITRSQYPRNRFIHFGRNRAVIDGTLSIRGTIEVKNMPGLDRAEILDLGVVRTSSCPNTSR
jgi:hypothetical protein